MNNSTKFVHVIALFTLFCHAKISNFWLHKSNYQSVLIVNFK